MRTPTTRRGFLGAAGLAGLGAVAAPAASARVEPTPWEIKLANLWTWIDVPIKSILEAECGARCGLENDANAGAVAEHRFGAGKGTRNMVFLTMGTGLGAGIIADGRLYAGANDSAGEIGHVRLTRTGPVGYHKAGSVEGWASGGGMAQVAAKVVAAAVKRGEKTTLAECMGTIAARDVGEAAFRGDALAVKIVRSTGRRLGEGLAIQIGRASCRERGEISV